MTLVAMSDLVALLGFSAAFILALLLPPFGYSTYTRPVKWLLVAAMGLYLFISVSNFLEWAGVTAALDPLEDYAEILFVPMIAYIGYSLAAARQLEMAVDAEKAIRREHELLESIVAASPAGTMVVGPDGSISFANQQARQLLGLVGDELEGRYSVGEDVSIGSEPGAKYRASRLLTELVARGRVEGLVRFIEGVEGERAAVEISATPLAESEGAAVVTLVDVTERMRYHRDLERAVDVRTRELLDMNERLREANATKEGFMARMSHELRTPLNSIIGFTGVMLSGGTGELNEEQGRQLGMVRKSGLQLLDIVNDVLDMSVIESGRLRVERRTVDVGVFLTGVVDAMQPQAHDHGVELIIDPVDPSSRFATDEDKLGQIVRNLVTNAIKFTDPGGTVTVSAACSDDRYVLTVSDTGVGIAEEDLGTIFEPFQQIDIPDRVKPPGTGLGLAICKDLAELLGGAVEVSSAPGQGSTFTVSLPMGA
jgi:PAS domain S-box-containing protein